MSSGLGRLRPRGARAIAIGAPAAAALTLSLLVLSSRQELDAELQLEAEEHAAAGETLALRARLYAGLSRIEGPSLQAAPCRVELLTEDRAVLATSWLRPGLGPSLEGAIAIPASLHGRVLLRARAALGEQRVSVERELLVGSEGDRAAPIAPLPRRLPALQRLALGPLRPSAAGAPSALRPRIRGGACVPEQPCELLVYVGAPAAALQLRATPSATPDAASAQASRVTSGVVALQLVVHGPEAVTELVATRAGVELASRSLRLEVALSSTRALVASASWRAAERPRVALADAGSTACIVDAYGRDGRLRHTATLRDCAQPSALPFALEPGINRLQLRGDPFGSDSAAVATLYARAAAESPADELAALARSALAIDGSDELARMLSADPNAVATESEPEPALALATSYLLAIHDQGLYATPSAVSGLPEAQLELAALREGHKKLGLLVLALAALALAALVAERGISSSAEARAVLAAAGSDAAAQRRQRTRSLLQLVSTVASLLLLFALVAVYVIVRAKGTLPP